MTTFFYKDNTGNYKFTPEGDLVVKILRERDNAWIMNQDYVLGWFKGMNIEPGPENVIEFADELQEYVTINNKKSIWGGTINTGEYVKWNYYAQESRPNGKNIVDDQFIQTRILKLKDPLSGHSEYVGRNLTFNYGTLYQNTAAITAIFGNFDGTSQEASSHVLAWFKGVNLAPTQGLVDIYSNYIKAYLEDPRKELDTNIDIGIFLVK